MKRALILAAIAASCVASVTASAQTGAARGKVVDEAGAPVEGAKVVLDFKGDVTRTYETKTNKKGEYTQVGLRSGMYEITATKEGYQPDKLGGRINLGEPTYLPDMKLRKGAAAGAAAAGPSQADQLRTDFKAALDLTQAGKFDEAEAAYKTLLEKAPSIPEIHYNLGYLYTQKKDWKSAEAAFQKAIELKPDYTDAVVALAKVYQDSGQQDKGIEMMSKAASSEDPKVLFNLGIFYLNSGRSEDAIAAFQKVEAKDPANAEAHYHLGTLYVGQNKIPDAVAQLEKYLAMGPQNPQNKATAEGLLSALKPKK